MRELLYTALELEEWCNKSTCWFCSSFGNKAVCQIRIRSKLTDKIVANACACENCKERFENDELPKCNNCERLQIKANILSGKYICDCVRYNEEVDEKELPVLPHERKMDAFYERQINALQEKEKELTEEVDTHLEALKSPKIDIKIKNKSYLIE